MTPRLVLIVAGSAASLWLSGCALMETPAESGLDLELPEGWVEREAGKPMPDSDWVASFGDATLSGLVAEALEENKDVWAALARIGAAEANAVIAGANQIPQVNLGLDGVRSSRNFIGFPFGGGGPQQVQTSLSNTFGLGLDMRWELDLWGRIKASKDAALSDLGATQADYEALRLSIAGQTAQAWFGVIAAQQQDALAARALEIFKDSEATIRGEFEEGVVRQGADVAAELQLALADVETARAQLMQRREDLMRQRKQTEVLLARYPSGKLRADATLPAIPASPPAGIPAEVLDRRPDLRAAERRLAAADQRVVEAKRSLLPAISLTGAYGTSTPDLGEILNSDFTVWNIAGNVAQPILDGRRLRQTVKGREADWERVLAEYQQTALTAFREVEEALAADRYLSERQEAITRASEYSRQALERARANYGAGVGEVLTLLRSQQQFIDAESSLIEVKRLRLINRIHLHLALGGDFKARDGGGVELREE